MTMRLSVKMQKHIPVALVMSTKGDKAITSAKPSSTEYADRK